jgi:hypothetical protein
MKHYKKPDGSVWAFEVDGSQAEEEQRCIDHGGVACDAPEPSGPSFADLKAVEIASYIDTREKMCARVAGIGQRLGRAGDNAGALSCDAVVNALLDVLAHPTVTGAADIESLRVALKTRYLAAVGLASASAIAEFKRYDKRYDK